MSNLLAHGVNGLELENVVDPAGGDQPTVEIVYRAANGDTVRSGLYVGVHGGGPLNLRCLVGNANTGTTGVFETDSGNGRIQVTQL